MEAININYVAVLVAVVANFFLGYIWYTPLFGKIWMKEMGFDANNKPTSGQMIKGMVIMVMGNFLMAYVFAHNIAAWSFVPGANEMSPTASIMSSVIFTWLGFYFPVDIGAVAWENKSWKMFGINTGYHFCMLLVAALILNFM
jgi:Protein of unknown function (DUF1761)